MGYYVFNVYLHLFQIRIIDCNFPESVEDILITRSFNILGFLFVFTHKIVLGILCRSALKKL